MKRSLPLFLFVLLLAAVPAGAQTILTLAGSGTQGFAGDGGSALSAQLNTPSGVAIDAQGNFYIADRENHRVRRVSAGGVISTVAGTGVPGFSGDGGPAVAASLNQPTGIAIDGSGNLFIADAQNRRLRRVGTDGIINTVAGTGVEGHTGDGGPARNAQLGRPVGVFVDISGNIYIVDSVGHRVRRINTDGTIFKFAGSGAPGFSGDGGPADSAQLNFPLGISADAAGNVYIADAENHRIRRVFNGVITTVAGRGTSGSSGDGGPALSAGLNFPSDVAVDGSGVLFIADTSNNRIRMVSGGNISTVAGTGSDSFSGDGGPAASAAVNAPYRISVGRTGGLVVSDTRNHRVRRISGIGGAVPAPGTFPFNTNVPNLPSGSAVNGASFSAGAAVAPGSIISIFGTGLAGSTISATAVPLPTTLGDTSVLINGQPVPLFFVASGQVNAQIPFDLPAGQATIQVRRGSETSASQTLNVSASGPGIFAMNAQGTGQGAILNQQNVLAQGANGAARGSTIQVFATGLGAVNPPVAAGRPGPSAEPFARVTSQVSATIAGIAAEVQFAGLAPGFVGLYQVNVVVPAGVPSGVQQLVLSQGGISSNPVTFTVQ